MATEHESKAMREPSSKTRQGEAATPPERIRAMLERVPADADRILDLGCVRHSAARRSRGDLHSQLVQRTDAEVIGIDTAVEGVEAMRNRGYEVRTGDATAFDFTEPFDAIVAGDIIEHLDRPGAMLECARRNLSPSGRLILSTPNVWCWFFTAQSLRGHVHCNSEHTCWYDSRTLTQLMERKGFSLTDMTELVTVPSSVEQAPLRAAFRAIGKLPLSKAQRAPTLVAAATPA